MEENNNINTNIPNVDPSKFVFVREQNNVQIKDEKFKTKSTTFAKDAFKRFCKNKSSVVGAIIIAILMLGSIFVPVISPYDTTSTQDINLQILPPKLFDAGFGFWDGTATYSGVLAYDGETDSYYPTNTDFCRPNAVIQSSLQIHDVVYYDYSSPNFYGGTIRISARNISDTGKVFYYQNNTPFKATSDGNYKMTLIMDNIDNLKENYKLDDYCLKLMLKPTKTTKDKDATMITLVDWTNDYPTAESPLEIDISKALEDAGVSESKYTQLRFEGKENSNYYSYFLINNLQITCDDPEVNELLDEISITDPNFTSLLDVNKDSGTWVSSGDYNVYHASFSKVTYKYDLYEHYLGYRENFVIGLSKMQEYIDKGWCEYDVNVGKDSFKVLDDRCPIVANNDGEYVTSQTKTTVNGTEFYQMECNIIYYKYIGFNSMPRFLLGTDKFGRACFTHALRCLKNSLLVSIICCAVCIAIGLVWGAISGYYGGAVDLIMERITDIIAGIPGTVVLTLILLLMGRNMVTFAFAVCLTGWIGTSGLTRTQFYRFKNRESVLAARTLGANDTRLIFKHILPNSLGTIVTSCVLDIPSFIFTEASLSFLHLGLSTGDSFGVLISENQQFISTRPALVLFPALVLCLMMISFNLFGNGLRDALNPTLKGGEQ